MRNVIIVIILAAVILFLLSLGRVMDYTNTPGFCRRCHIIEPFYQGWAEAEHAQRGVVCIHCHFKPGVTGYLQGKAYAAIKLAEFALGAYNTPRGARLVTNQNCLRCHEEILTQEIALAGGLAFYHEQHVDRAKAECRQCHPAIGHPGAVAQAIVTQPPRIAKDACLGCHDGQRAPVVFGSATPSGKIHPGEPKVDTGLWKQTHWQAAIGPISIEGQPFEIDEAVCIGCHGDPTQVSSCQGCHTLPATTYPPGVRSCLRCHQEAIGQRLEVEGMPYYHERHLLYTDLICQDCHVKITHQEICVNCHNGQRAPAIFSRAGRLG
ncbi:MAG: NapC/NirT family cytochrome c [Anaerolineae bacterium]